MRDTRRIGEGGEGTGTLIIIKLLGRYMLFSCQNCSIVNHRAVTTRQPYCSTGGPVNHIGGACGLANTSKGG